MNMMSWANSCGHYRQSGSSPASSFQSPASRVVGERCVLCEAVPEGAVEGTQERMQE